MPVYEYRCTSCHREFEIEHRMSEKRTECAECQGTLERLISRTSFAFKGGGWYKDLYASPKPGAASSDDGGSSSSSSSSKPANDGGSSGSGSSSTGGSTSGTSSGSSPGGGSSSSASSSSSGVAAAS